MEQSVGILAYGSLISNPLDEIGDATVETLKDVLTPFNVEFARSSRGRRGAPTLIPVTVNGSPVLAHLFVVDADVGRAKDMLYRREINKVGEDLPYKHHENPGVDDVVIKSIEELNGIDVVLYTQIARNIKELTPSELARLAINSAHGPEDRRDGITYLMDAKKYGIKTPLMDAYEEQIKKEMEVESLYEALLMARHA